MQIIVNCFTPYGDGFVMLQKPRRGWWVLPGGKVDAAEIWPDAAKREMMEEAGLVVDHLVLHGIYHLHIAASDTEAAKDRLIVQFSADCVGGELLESCKEGKLSVIRPGELNDLPMDEGDRLMVRRTLEQVASGVHQVSFGRFSYDADHRLLEWTMSPGA
ncbi:putative Nudix hydrolase YvcI [Alicyclobacillus contaminans]|nr:putative Nudix hydrolase YvcI [Alicyclobacillus contaminans]